MRVFLRSYSGPIDFNGTPLLEPREFHGCVAAEQLIPRQRDFARTAAAYACENLILAQTLPVWRSADRTLTLCEEFW